MQDLDQILVPKGTLIHIDGMPFEIKEDIYVLGFAENAKLSTQLKAGAKNDHCTNNNLSFSDALNALKQDKKVARSGWNGKDQYVVAQAQTTTTEASKIWNSHNKAHAEKLGGQIDVAPYCTLKTAQDALAMGWTPSTGDLFANDWLILE